MLRSKKTPKHCHRGGSYLYIFTNYKFNDYGTGDRGGSYLYIFY